MSQLSLSSEYKDILLSNPPEKMLNRKEAERKYFSDMGLHATTNNPYV